MGCNNGSIFVCLRVYPNRNLMNLFIPKTKKALDLELMRGSLTGFDGQG